MAPLKSLIFGSCMLMASDNARRRELTGAILLLGQPREPQEAMFGSMDAANDLHREGSF